MTVRRTASPKRIAAAIRRVIENPSYQDAASRLGKIIRHDAGSGPVVDELGNLHPSESSGPATSVDPPTVSGAGPELVSGR